MKIEEYEEYRDFSLRLHQKGVNKPLVGQFELTFRCNLRCQHCYVVEDVAKTELTFKECCSILDQIHKEGCLWICFTGGEPLLRTDFLDIYTYAKRLGFLITIFTNGTLITEKIANYFKEHPPFSIEITLNGITQKTYETITQIPGSFEQAMKGINLIIKRKLPLKLKAEPMTLNYHELIGIKEFSKKLGITFKCTTIISSKIDGSTSHCSLRLPPEKIIELENSKDLIYERDEIEDLFRDEKGEFPSPSDNLFRCPAGTWTFHINPYGELFLCSFVRKPSFDLKKGSFKDGFYELFPKILSAKYKTNSKCRNCKIYYLCDKCPGRAKLETGDPEKPIEYFCKLAHMRAEKEGVLV